MPNVAGRAALPLGEAPLTSFAPSPPTVCFVLPAQNSHPAGPSPCPLRGVEMFATGQSAFGDTDTVSQLLLAVRSTQGSQGTESPVKKVGGSAAGF